MFTVVSRRKDAGIFRSLGASRREIFFAFTTEILLLGSLGGALGGLAGYLLSRFLTTLVAGTISNLYFFLRPAPQDWSWWILLISVFLGCGASILGGLFPLAVAAFMAALSMAIGLSSMIGSFRQSLIWWMDTQLQADLFVGKIAEMEVPESFYSARHLKLQDFVLSVLDRWKSARSGGEYPSRWKVQVPSAQIELDLAPLLADQELNTGGSTGVIYSEGDVAGGGTSGGLKVSCEGYVELTGYAGSLGGLF